MITTIDKNTALVLIDLQNGVVQMAADRGIEKILENSAKLVAAFREAKLPVVLVTLSMEGSPAFKTRKDAPPRSGWTPAPDFGNLAPEIKAEEGDIHIVKKQWGAFYGTELQNELQKRGVTQIVLAGVATSIGVEATARSANEFGYNITFASDATADLFDEAHTHSFKYIFPRIGEVGTTNEIIAQL